MLKLVIYSGTGAASVAWQRYAENPDNPLYGDEYPRLCHEMMDEMFVPDKQSENLLILK